MAPVDSTATKRQQSGRLPRSQQGSARASAKHATDGPRGQADGFMEQAQVADGNVQSTLILADPFEQTEEYTELKNEKSEELERKRSLLKIQEIRMGRIDLDHMFEQDFIDL